MYERKVLGLEEVQKAVQAMLQEIPKGDARPISIAVMDDRGGLITLVRTDGAREFTNQMAIRKAYTSAHWRRSTREVGELMQRRNWSLREFGPEWMLVPGGVPIIDPSDGTVYGSIGISGRIPAEEDEAIAMVGVKAIQAAL